MRLYRGIYVCTAIQIWLEAAAVRFRGTFWKIRLSKLTSQAPGYSYQCGTDYYKFNY